MLRKVMGHGLIYTLATVLTRGISFLLLPLYTRILSPSDYGLIDIVTLIITFVNLVIALEVTQALARYLNDLDNSLKTRYVSTAFNFTLVVYILFTIVFILFEKWISPFIFSSQIENQS
ncbi:lipopolysaccharide biosynthesis protein, partial [Solibacillus silvestris]|uniref:lipopolysaccharide biosynthesis protein n=1 Tax=Solibacillus silvestris TaxID=76853 RepID=UPI003F81B491